MAEKIICNFDSIIGNDDIKKYLEKIILEDKIPNSFIFSGIDGIGKSLFAKNLAKYLMYPEKVEEDYLDKIEKEIHPDLMVYKLEGKSAMHPISSIRDMIDQSSFMPFESKAKVFIIHDANRMSSISFNALLKILEEPPLDSYFFLLTNDMDNILPTIISRCRVIRFSPIDMKSLVNIIKKWGKTEKEANKIAKLSCGSISKASEISSYVDHDEKTHILIYLLSKENINYLNLQKALKRLDEIFTSEEETFKKFEYFLLQIYLFYKDLFLLKDGIAKDMLYFDDKIDILYEKIKRDELVDLEKLEGYLKEAKEAFLLNVNITTCLENLFLKIFS